MSTDDTDIEPDFVRNLISLNVANFHPKHDPYINDSYNKRVFEQYKHCYHKQYINAHNKHHYN